MDGLTNLAFLELLRSSAVEISAVNGKLRLSAPSGILTAEIQQEVRRRKAELIDLLTSEAPVVGKDVGRSHRTAPLTYAQQRIWLTEAISPGTSAYTIHEISFLDVPVSLEHLQEAISRLMERHDVLRTWIGVSGATAVQYIAKTLTTPVGLTDLSSHSTEARSTALREVIRQQVALPFHLEEPPLIRCHLIRLHESSHVIVLCLHHILADGPSMVILRRELSMLYTAAAEGRDAGLARLPLQFADYAFREQNDLEEKQVKQLAYWRGQLAGAPHLLELPFNKTRPVMPSLKGAALRIVLSEDLTASLRRFAQTEHVSLYMLLLAAFSVLLLRYTDQEDMCIGTPVSRRSLPGTEQLIGLFIDSVVMRCQPKKTASFREFLLQVRGTALDAYDHSDLPFQWLVKELAAVRDAGTTPIFQIMFALDIAESEEREYVANHNISDVAESFGQILDISKFDLTLQLKDLGKTISGMFEYRVELVAAENIEQLAESFVALLESILESPNLALSELQILSKAQRKRVLEDWNATALDYPLDATIHSLFEKQAAHFPDAIAVIGDGVTSTYEDLNARSNRLAHLLLERGLGAEECVGVFMNRSIDLIVSLLAVLKAGGAYVPLDPAYPAARLETMMNNSRARFILSEESLLTRLPGGNHQVIFVDQEATAIRKMPSLNPCVPMASRRLAYVIYTSGSTGIPKGVAIEHRSTVSFIHWAKATHTAEELVRVLAVTSICFDLSIFEIFVPLSWGYTIVLVADAMQLGQGSERGSATLVNTVPGAVAALMSTRGFPSPVRRVNMAGEPLPVALVQQIEQRSPNVHIYDLYGPTEATTYATCARRFGDEPATIGGALANTQIYILDSQLQPVAPGVPGQIFIGGVQVAREYLHQPELTAERFVTLDHLPGAGRVYQTGDLGKFRRDGQIEFLGRMDQQVKIRGFRIELGEIESVLRQHPHVVEAVVVVQKSLALGNSLMGFVTVVETHPQLAELVDFQKTLLPAYMVVDRLEILEVFPFTPNGKIDKKALAEKTISGPKNTGNIEQEPSDEVERLLLAIWQKGFETSSIGLDDDFFALGGHSLLALRLFSEIEKEFKVTMMLAVLFQSPTIRMLSKEIRRKQL